MSLPITDWPKVRELSQSLPALGTQEIDAAHLAHTLRQRVRGQDHVVDDLARYITINYARERGARPIASALFVGQTGCGKTELARALAAYLYGRDDNALFFSGGELEKDTAIDFLIGAPLMYRGAERGGALTTPIRDEPRRIVVFDELDKMHADVPKLLLTMLDEGSVLDMMSQQRPSLSQCIVILTMNSGHEALTDLLRQHGGLGPAFDRAARTHLGGSPKYSPEILGRIGRIYPFNALSPLTRAEVLVKVLQEYAASFRLTLTWVDPAVVSALARQCSELRCDARDVDRLVQHHFDLLFYTQSRQPERHIQVVRQGEAFALIGSEPGAPPEARPREVAR